MEWCITQLWCTSNCTTTSAAHNQYTDIYPQIFSFIPPRNYTSPLLNFLAFNNGYHTIHHLAPTSHWTVNKALHEQLVLPHIDKRLDQISMLEYWLNTYVRNGNPWNKEQVSLSLSLSLSRRFKGLYLYILVISFIVEWCTSKPLSSSITSYSSTSISNTHNTKIHPPPTLSPFQQRHLDYKGVEIVLRERESQSRITYDEWLDFPKGFDSSTLPETMSEFGARILVLVCKFLISPLYSMDPTVRMI